MLRIENVFKSYGKKEVLKGVTFSLKENEIKGLVGVNGVGKSTLIEIICGVKKMNSGHVYFYDKDITDKKERKERKKLIGYMPQSFTLFNDLTVQENLGYLCAVYGFDAKKIIPPLLERCYLSSYKKVLAKNLSGGYRQLLSLAGAIIHNPKLIILDEPTSAMDPLFRKKFWGIIRECKKEGATVLIITHYMEEVNECDSFVCLSEGKVAFDGKVSDFQESGFLDIEKILQSYASEVPADE